MKVIHTSLKYKKTLVFYTLFSMFSYKNSEYINARNICKRGILPNLCATWDWSKIGRTANNQIYPSVPPQSSTLLFMCRGTAYYARGQELGESSGSATHENHDRLWIGYIAA